jgi:hypothetical protein
MGRTALGVLLVAVLIGVVVYSALHGAMIGVILAGPPALLFIAALLDNRFVYSKRKQGLGEEPGSTPPPPDSSP